MFNRRIILVLLVLSCSFGLAQAEWNELLSVSNSGGFILYFEPTSLRIDKQSGMVKVWLLYDYKIAQKDYRGIPYLSIRVQREYDCKEMRARTLAQTLFDDNMARGNPITDDSTRSWEPVEFSSIGETLWSIACDRTTGMPREPQRSNAGS